MGERRDIFPLLSSKMEVEFVGLVGCFVALASSMIGYWIYDLRFKLAKLAEQNQQAVLYNQHLQAEMVKIFHNKCTDIETSFVAEGDPVSTFNEDEASNFYGANIAYIVLLLTLTVLAYMRTYGTT